MAVAVKKIPPEREGEEIRDNRRIRILIWC
jgi:hypothetical protein